MEAILKVFVIFAAFESILSLPSDKRGVVNEAGVSSSLPNARAGRQLNEWIGLKKKGNPEEQGGYFEGDIIVNDEARNGIISEEAMWKDATIPYVVEGSFSKLRKLLNSFQVTVKNDFSAQREKNLLSDAIEEYQRKTCLRFRPKGGEKDYIVFNNAQTGCWSNVGKIGGPQTVNLQSSGCTGMIGTVLHEILHALGFYHEQNRYDRDEFVKINYANIKPDTFVNFEKVSEDEISSYGIGYDYDSVLHYSPYAFSSNNKKTIEAIGSPSINDRMGQRVGFSKGDIAKINAMYCSKKSNYHKQ